MKEAEQQFLVVTSNWELSIRSFLWCMSCVCSFFILFPVSPNFPHFNIPFYVPSFTTAFLILFFFLLSPVFLALSSWIWFLGLTPRKLLQFLAPQWHFFFSFPVKVVKSWTWNLILDCTGPECYITYCFNSVNEEWSPLLWMQLIQLYKEAWKNSELQWGFNPWHRDAGAML